jgi:hypothetical protein
MGLGGDLFGGPDRNDRTLGQRNGMRSASAGIIAGGWRRIQSNWRGFWGRGRNRVGLRRGPYHRRGGRQRLGFTARGRSGRSWRRSGGNQHRLADGGSFRGPPGLRGRGGRRLDGGGSRRRRGRDRCYDGLWRWGWRRRFARPDQEESNARRNQGSNDKRGHNSHSQLPLL